MAENLMMNAAEDRWKKMNARSEAIFAEIQVKLKILLLRYNCSDISFHGAENSFKEIPNSESLNVSLSSSMQDDFRSSTKQIEVTSVREPNFSVEVVTPVGDFSDGFMDLSTPTMTTITDTTELFAVESFLDNHGHFNEPPENMVVDGSAKRNRGLSLTSEFSSFTSDSNGSGESKERIREPMIKFDDFLDESKVRPVSVYGNFDVDTTGIQHDSRFVPPDNFISCGTIEILGTYDIAHTTYLTKSVYGMPNYIVSYPHMDIHLDTHFLDTMLIRTSTTQFYSVFNRPLPKPPYVICVVVAYPPPPPPDRVVVLTVRLVQHLKPPDQVTVLTSLLEPPILKLPLTRPPAKPSYHEYHTTDATWMAYSTWVVIPKIVILQSNVSAEIVLVKVMKKMDLICIVLADEQFGDPKTRMQKVVWSNLRLSLRGVVSWHQCLVVQSREQFHILLIGDSIVGVRLSLCPTYYKPYFLEPYMPLRERGLFLVKEQILETFANTWQFCDHKFTVPWDDHEKCIGEAHLAAIYYTHKGQLVIQKIYIADLFHGSLGFDFPIMMMRIDGATYIEKFESLVDANIHALLELLEDFPWGSYFDQLAIEWLFRIDDIRVGAVLQKFYIIFGDERHFYIFHEVYAAAILYTYLDFWCMEVFMLSILALSPYLFYAWWGLMDMGHNLDTMFRAWEVVIWRVVILGCSSVKRFEESTRNFTELEKTWLSTNLATVLLMFSICSKSKLQKVVGSMHNYKDIKEDAKHSFSSVFTIAEFPKLQYL